MILFATAVGCAWMTVAAAGGKPGDQDEIGYGAQITYLAPDDLRMLPKRVRSELTQRKCLVPKKGFWGHRNVLQGSFGTSGQIDWAVVCSVDGKFHIQLSWGGRAYCKSEIPLHGWQVLGRVGRKYVMQMYENFGGEKPPPITHDAIDALMVGKAASVIYYCHDGEWKELVGSD